MKRKQILAVLVLLYSILPQMPAQKMSYQAVIRDNENHLVANKMVGMQISIIQGSEYGAIVYSEIHSTTTNINGLANIVIGNGISTIGNITVIDWPRGPFFLKTEIDPIGGNNYTITAINQLLSVPYALYAERSAPQNNFDRIFIENDSQMGSPHLMLHETGNDYARISFRSNYHLPYWTIAAHISDNNANDRLNFYHSLGGDILTISPSQTTINKNLEVKGESYLQNLQVNGNSVLQSLQVNGSTNLQNSLSINGNPGGNGQVLTSKGPGQKPVWGSGVNAMYNGIYSAVKDYPTSLTGGSYQTDQIIQSFNVSVDKNSILKLQGNYEATGDNSSCFLVYDVYAYTGTYPVLINNQPDRITGQGYHFAKPSAIYRLTPGNFTFRVNVTVFSPSSNIYFFNSQNTNTLIEIIPEF